MSSAGASRFGAAPAGLFLSLRALSPYVSSCILPMSPPDTQVCRVLLRQRAGMPASSLPFLLYKTLEVGEVLGGLHLPKVLKNMI
jgi:hypothetical protein